MEDEGGKEREEEEDGRRRRRGRKGKADLQVWQDLREPGVEECTLSLGVKGSGAGILSMSGEGEGGSECWAIQGWR